MPRRPRHDIRRRNLVEPQVKRSPSGTVTALPGGDRGGGPATKELAPLPGYPWRRSFGAPSPPPRTRVSLRRRPTCASRAGVITRSPSSLASRVRRSRRPSGGSGPQCRLRPRSLFLGSADRVRVRLGSADRVRVRDGARFVTTTVRCGPALPPRARPARRGP